MAALDFKGKALVQNYHLSVKYHELVPKRDRSLTDKVRLDDNLIIHGDNLKALKALLPTYAGQVKCVYIDPPYNTGNEGWAYNDNVNSPMMQEWLGKAVDREDLTRHDKWLCMMSPRLKLLRELLAENGAIFVSMDDSEAAHLRCLMDEIFGDGNFIADILWQKRTSPDARLIFSDAHEHIFCFAKNHERLSFNKVPQSEEQRAAFKNPDNDPRGSWVSSDYTAQGFRPNQMYEITTSSGRKVKPPPGTCWKNVEEVLLKLVSDNRIWFGKDGNGMPRRKTFLSESDGISPWTWWANDEVGHTQEAKKEILDVFGKEDIFDTPKPLRLIQRILQIATSTNSLVLDSFAGSGTTAHAVLALNKEDGGKRKFILVECEDYADSITAERVRRVIKGVKGASDEHLKKGLGGTFSYFELGKAIELDSILDGKNLPSYLELARYVFYTATGEEFDERKVNEKRSFVGESKTHEVYLFYQPDMDYLKKTALTLERAESLGKIKDKRRLVFAPTKYLDQEQLDTLRIDFAQLPFEIYKLAT